MSSIANFCRTAARRSGLFATRSVTSYAPGDTPTALADLTSKLRESAPSAELDAPSPSAASASGYPGQAYTPNGQEQPLVKSFSSRWVKPKDFTRKAREAVTRRTKPELLGPDAKEARQLDIFYQLNIDPLAESENSRLLSYFVTEMGKIKPRSQTNLTWRNQRRLGKAIRRAKMMGIIPMLSRRDLKTTM